jgi:glyceraldehyde-3-phosphate dehydrogenase/erythrose-4-phosphate dehydrogenase
MTTRIGINGFGRIGRALVRCSPDRHDLEIVAVNDITDVRTLAHLLAFDSTFGKLPVTVDHTDDSILVDGRAIRALSLRDPASIRWGDLGVDVVIESTGKFRGRDDAALHLKGGAGAARTTGVVMPQLAGRLDGVALRVPVEDGSLTDLTTILAMEVTAGEVNKAFELAAAGPLAGVVRYSADPLVSRDIIGDPASCIYSTRA